MNLQLFCLLQTEDCPTVISGIQRTMFAHGAMSRQINPSWGGPIELFLVPASAPQLV